MTQAAPAHTLGPVSGLDYHHVRKLDLPVPVSPIEVWNIITSGQGVVLRLAFHIRDFISSRFGVQRIGGFSGQQRSSVKAGDMLDFFLVEHSDPGLLILTARDRHLDVMVCLSVNDGQLTMTSSVITHNNFGRLYMVPVRPAHELIVHKYLKRLQRTLQLRASSPG